MGERSREHRSEDEIYDEAYDRLQSCRNLGEVYEVVREWVQKYGRRADSSPQKLTNQELLLAVTVAGINRMCDIDPNLSILSAAELLNAEAKMHLRNPS